MAKKRTLVAKKRTKIIGSNNFLIKSQLHIFPQYEKVGQWDGFIKAMYGYEATTVAPVMYLSL